MEFDRKHTEQEDISLIDRSLQGDIKALDSLIKKHQNFIYNAALNMVSDPDVAADLTQEVLIKMLTSLVNFQHRSSFQTWLYRIVKNTFLNMKRGNYEVYPFSFQDFAHGLDNTPNVNLADTSYSTDHALLAEEGRLSCMKDMLLCLEREQRFIYIIGEQFGFSDLIGSQIMDISRENFRVKLHRAKTQLYSLMDSKCGLVNKSNPCRCANKQQVSLAKVLLIRRDYTFKKTVLIQ